MKMKKLIIIILMKKRKKNSKCVPYEIYEKLFNEKKELKKKLNDILNDKE